MAVITIVDKQSKAAWILVHDAYVDGENFTPKVIVRDKFHCIFEE